MRRGGGAFPFPVGDDPNDPDVLEYWMSVARRLDGLLLPRDLKGWRELIAARVSAYRVAAAAVAAEAAVRLRQGDEHLRRRSGYVAWLSQTSTVS